MKNITLSSRGGAAGGQYFNVSYGKASTSLSGTAKVIIATTQAAFHGMAIVNTGTNTCIVYVYDSISSAAGNIVGMISLPAATGTQWDLNTPTIAKNGLVAIKTDTASQVTIFYGPKG